ncbi:MAG: inositol monophosphatase [Candidatus Marinimicrobia bacterium]|nr:inositol monophosphatase [Candidatus Neomarinimicrobiota bacterium]|tara:strand:+ start:227 stop:1021 length:795 start_codon:yes stop_codon:yes gene_type:complete
MKYNYEQIVSVLKSASLLGSEVIMNTFLKTDINISLKSENNYVTDADINTERVIIERIKKDFPNSGFICEESGNQTSSDSDMSWIIDPIDGTNNFISGYPHFCISIGVLINDKLVSGSIFNPISNEFFHAVKGKGSFLNGKKIKVSSTKSLSDSILGTGFIMSDRNSIDINLKNLNKLIKGIRSFRRSGSAALDLAYVACGRLDGFWHLDLKPWDIAAGAILVQEADGIVTGFRNEDFNLYSKDLLASNINIHKEIMDGLFKNE